MISLKTYKWYCERLALICGDYRLILAVSEDHLKKKLKGDDEFVFVAVYPSHNGTGSEDNVRDVDTILLYLLKVVNKTDTDEDKEFGDFVFLQEQIDMIKKQIIYDADTGEDFLRNLDRESIEIYPVDNIAGSSNGYSLVFTI